MKNVYASFFLFLLVLWPAASGVQAEEPPSIVISEINWAGSSASIADEWIELYNPNGEDLDLSGWILTGSASGGEAILIADGVMIPATSTLVIANYDLASEKTTLMLEPDLVTSSLSLSNSNFEILLTTPEGLVVDEATREAGSSSPSISQERNLETLEWFDATENINLTNPAQYATPGVVKHALPTEEPEETSSETVDEPLTDEELRALCDELAQEGAAQQPSETEETENTTPDDETTTEPEEDPEPSSESEDETEVEVAVVSFTSGDVLVNEVVSDPEDGVEWIELYNPSDTLIDLAGWTVEDRAGRDTVLSGAILPDGYVVIESPNGQLNNDGDDVVLKDPNGNVINQVTYDERPPKKGESYAREPNNAWTVTNILTPGQENVFEEVLGENDEIDTQENIENNTSEDEESASDSSSAESVHRIVAVATAPVLAKNTVTHVSSGQSKSSDLETVTGIVTAIPGTFGKQVAFIEGVQLYFHHADWPELSPGDVVEVTGERSSSRGEPRIKISSIENLVVTGHVELHPTFVTVSELTSDFEGHLVALSGDMVTREGDKMTFADETGDVVVVAHTQSGIRWTQFDGVQMSITGVVRHIDGEVRLYPRSLDDIAENTQEETLDETNTQVVASAPNMTPWIGAGLVATTGTGLTYWYAKERKRLRLLSNEAALTRPKQQPITHM